MSTRSTGSCCAGCATLPTPPGTAVVVPDTALAAATRVVPTWVRQRLSIDVYAVSLDGDVTLSMPDA
jgi:hypothetical protein